jgi:hypothetical protein
VPAIDGDWNMFVVLEDMRRYVRRSVFGSNFFYFCDGAASKKKCPVTKYFEGSNNNISVHSTKYSV